MKNHLTFFCSVVLCLISLNEAKVETCEPPPKVADEQEFKFTPCENNAADTCEVQYEDFDSKSVFKFTAPEGKVFMQDNFKCNFTVYMKHDTADSHILSCQIGEQKSINDKYFEPEIKPIEAGETRFIACYCGDHKSFGKDNGGFVKTELLVYGKRKYCYYLDVTFSKEKERAPEEFY